MGKHWCCWYLHFLAVGSSEWQQQAARTSRRLCPLESQLSCRTYALRHLSWKCSSKCVAVECCVDIDAYATSGLMCQDSWALDIRQCHRFWAWRIWDPFLPTTWELYGSFPGTRTCGFFFLLLQTATLYSNFSAIFSQVMYQRKEFWQRIFIQDSRNFGIISFIIIIIWLCE